MSRSVSILLAERPSIEDVESLIAEKFEVTSWFPVTPRWTVEHDLTQVFLDYDTHPEIYHEQYEEETRKAWIEEKLGKKPVLALHVQISTVYPGSKELALRVAGMVLERWKGILDDACR